MSGGDNSRKSMDDVLSSIRKIMRGGSAKLDTVPPAGSQAEGATPDTGDEWAVPPGAITDEERQLAEAEAEAESEAEAEAADQTGIDDLAGDDGELELAVGAADDEGEFGAAEDDDDADEDDDDDVLALGPAMQAPPIDEEPAAAADDDLGEEKPAAAWDEDFGTGPEAGAMAELPEDEEPADEEPEDAEPEDEDDDFIPPPPPRSSQIGLSVISGGFALGTGRVPPGATEDIVSTKPEPAAEPKPEPEPEHAASLHGEPPASEVEDTTWPPPAPGDLEETVRRVVREELAGEVGRKLSQNIRRLIREEIAHAMLRSD